MNDRLTNISRRRFHLPKADAIRRAVEHLSFVEKIIFYSLLALLSLSAFSLASRVNDLLLIEVPVQGGTLTEGVIGTPRFINSLLAISDADRDLTAVIYSGLLRATPEGVLLPDLAESYSVSSDGLIYTFILKDNLYFHDGVKLTADDVEFTVLKAQDPGLKSPKRANWDSVRVEKINPKEIHFMLKQPYAPFLENATIGILPKHLWKNVSADEFTLSLFNIEPIGSGPYRLQSIRRNSSGIPERYYLTPFKRSASGEPYIQNLVFSFYPNEDGLLEAYGQGDVDSINSIPPEKTVGVKEAEASITRTPLPRIFAVFFNQNQSSVFANPEVRIALDQSLDKEAIVNEIVGGFGVVAEGPLPVGILKKVDLVTTTSGNDRITASRKRLEDSGWKWNEGEKALEKKVKKDRQLLAFSISTSNALELKKAAAMIKETWEKVGARVEIKVFEIGDLSQNIIRPRKYDALLFGEVIGRDLDLFAFWHSSQRNDPGLNVALYTNIKADKLLSEARATADLKARLEKYQKFAEELRKDIPAVFLFSPEFIYVLPKTVKGVDIGRITIPSERFLSIQNWYIETEKVWSFFSKR